MTELEIYRQQIDSIDASIIRLLSERFETVKQVGIYKKERNIPPLQPERWAQVVETRKKWAQENGLDPGFIERLWDELHTYALEEEKKV